MSSDTIFALSSGRPPAAVAIIRTSGPQAFAAAEAIGGSLPPPRRAALTTLRDPADGSVIDQALVLRFDSPASATGENVVEYQCHGGRAVVDSLLDLLGRQRGFRPAEPGEFTRRAFENGRIDLTEAEALADLIEAETELQRRSALARTGMGLRIEMWRNRLVELSARAEAAIDYVGDEDETAADPARLASEARTLAVEWQEWLDRPRVEALKEGVRVVLAGPPNAGKSSLLNALCEEERAIVTSVAGTTRDVIEVPLAITGVPIVLVDTAGLRDSADPVEQLGVGRAAIETERADVLLWLGEPGEAPSHPHVILVHAQADRRGAGPPGSFAVSVVNGEGVRRLAEEISAKARSIIPDTSRVALNRRQADALASAVQALSHIPDDIEILADGLRLARSGLDRLSGRSGVEEMLDALFGRFCLGK